MEDITRETSEAIRGSASASQARLQTGQTDIARHIVAIYCTDSGIADAAVDVEVKSRVAAAAISI